MASAAPDLTACDTGLRDGLAAVLPKDVSFGAYHLSTPPRKTDALYSAPPKERPDRTYCENHFLAISIDVPAQDAASAATKKVLVLGVEIFIYTTAHTTTLFVSKADSTGYLHLLNLPKGTPSPIREVCATFVTHLLDSRRRKDKPFVISLFARAQDQYLFPGSIKYSGKHVLDDRGLIKWWCRVLDPLARNAPSKLGSTRLSSKGYLVVPGLDTYETRGLIPRTPDAMSHWALDHPLERISHYTREFDWVPPRCLIPRFPDDPKSRFRDELDEEAHQTGAMKTLGSWKSVKSLDVFWEMMAFRQECSSGRMTGFIWVVIDNKDTTAQNGDAPETPKKDRNGTTNHNTTPRKLFASKTDGAGAGLSGSKSDKKKKSQKKKKKKTKLRGMIKVRQPRIKQTQRNYLLKTPVHSPYYFWPHQGRGERIVDEKGYKRIMESLLHLDFGNLDKAVGSSRRWISEAGMGSQWGLVITGDRELPTQEGSSGAATNGTGQVNNLSGLVKRKRSDTNDGAEDGVNTLNAGLVKKKPKVEPELQEPNPEVNVLNVGLVRKKPKTG